MPTGQDEEDAHDDPRESTDEQAEDDLGSGGFSSRSLTNGWFRPLLDLGIVKRGLMPTYDFSWKHRPVAYGIDMSAFTRSFMPSYDASWVARAIAPTIESSSFKRGFTPSYKISWLTGSLTRSLRSQLTQSLTSSFFDSVKRQLDESRRELLRRSQLPTNLRNIADITSDDVLDFTEEHGISLYLVTPPNIACSFLNAKDSKAVRRILGDRRDDILRTCGAVLAECDAPTSAGFRTAAQQAIAAMDADLYYPAQATAGNLLDTLLRTALDQDLCDAAKRRPNETALDVRDRLANLDMWQGYIAMAMWTAFRHYHHDRGDQIPHTFTRHATAHGLGSTQYSRRSAVQGIMVATSAIAHMNGLS